MDVVFWKTIASHWCIITSAEDREKIHQLIASINQSSKERRQQAPSLAELIFGDDEEEDDDDGY